MGYRILFRKYLSIDLGILFMLIALPLYFSVNDDLSTIRRAILYSGFITPAISYLEIKKSHQLPFFDNLGVFLLPFYSVLLLLKFLFALIMS